MASGPAGPWWRAVKPFSGSPASVGARRRFPVPEPRRCGLTLSGAGSLQKQTGNTKLARVVFDEATIARRVAELGREITAAYPDGEDARPGRLR